MERQQDFAKVASGNFDFVIGEDKAQSFGIAGANKGRGDEVLKRKDVSLAGRWFNPQAGGRSLTVPARWRGREGWFVGFRAMFHFDVWLVF